MSMVVRTPLVEDWGYRLNETLDEAGTTPLEQVQIARAIMGFALAALPPNLRAETHRTEMAALAVALDTLKETAPDDDRPPGADLGGKA
jgi:hypothetical protein